MPADRRTPSGLTPAEMAEVWAAAVPSLKNRTAREIHEAEVQELRDDMATDAFLADWCAGHGVPYDRRYRR